MHVAVIAGHGPSLIRFRGPLIAAMRQAGHKVTALAPSPADGSTAQAVRDLGADFLSLPLSRRSLNPLADLRTLVVLTNMLRQLGPDAVLSYTIKPVIWGSLAAKRAGVERRYALVTGLGRAFAPGQGRAGSLVSAGLRLVVRHLYRRALKQCRLVFFQNQEDLALFRSLSIMQPEQAGLVLPGSGVDLSEYKPAPQAFDDIPQAEPPVFVCLARLLEDKGLREYQAVALRLRQVFPQVRFLLAGAAEAGPGALDRDEVAAWAGKDGEKGGVEYLGEVRDVRPLLAQATAFVLPSYYGEGVPRSALEAMAMARPVVTTDHPGCRETVIQGKTGFLVAPRDPQALADALGKYIESPDLARDMGLAARKLAEKRFDVRLVNRMILEAMDLS